MKLALINLNRYNDGDTPPLNLISIATYLNKNCDFCEIKIFDVNFEDVVESIKEFDPDLIGLSAMTVDYALAIEVSEKIKLFKDIPIVIGGVHISTLSSSMAKSFDIGVFGEGEETMLDIVKTYHLKKKFESKDLFKIKSIVFRNFNGRLVETRKRDPISPLDKLPMLDKSLIDKRYLEKRILPDGNYGVLAHLLTSRGCPYKCVFCSTSVFWGNKLRYHSPERIASEILDYVKNHDAKYLIIWDDLFAYKKFIKELRDEFRKQGINDGSPYSVDIPITCNLRANIVDDELCLLLKEMGVVRVGFGFESGSERYLKYLKAGSVTLEDIHNAIITCKRNGLLIGGSLIFGGPGETLDDMRDTLKLIDFMIKHDVDNVWSFVMTPFPGTEIWDIAKKRKKVDDAEMNWNLLSHQNMDNPLLLDESISLEDFKKVFLESRVKQQHFRWKKVKYDVVHNPFNIMKNVFKKPAVLYGLLFKKPIKE